MSVNTNMQIIRRTRTRTRTRKHATDSIMLAVSIISVVVIIDEMKK